MRRSGAYRIPADEREPNLGPAKWRKMNDCTWQKIEDDEDAPVEIGEASSLDTDEGWSTRATPPRS